MPKYFCYFKDYYLLLPNRFFKYKNELNFVKLYLNNNIFQLSNIKLIRTNGRKAIKLPKEIRDLVKKENSKYVIIETFS